MNNKYSNDPISGHPKSRNFWKPNLTVLGCWMALNGQNDLKAGKNGPLSNVIWIPTTWPDIQMPFENWIIYKPDLFPLFEYWTCLVFGFQLYSAIFSPQLRMPVIINSIHNKLVKCKYSFLFHFHTKTKILIQIWTHSTLLYDYLTISKLPFPKAKNKNFRSLTFTFV